MISAEEQQTLVSLSEISQDIRSHLMLMGELAAQKRKADTDAFQQLSPIACEP